MTRTLYFTIRTTNEVEIENLFAEFDLCGIVKNVPDSVSDEQVSERISLNYEGTTLELVDSVYEDPEFEIDWELIDTDITVTNDQN